MKKHLILSALWMVSPVFAEPAAVVPAPEVAAEAPQYIRVEKVETGTQLQTALVHFKKGDATLDLVGAVHIADGKFYHELNTLFEGYDALLYEGIGGDKRAAPPAAGVETLEEATDALKKAAQELRDAAGSDQASPEGEEADEAPAEDAEEPALPAKKGNLNGLHTAYEAGAKWLGLTYQMQEVDYSKANFVHADLTMDEFNDLQAQRGESLVGFMFRASVAKKDKAVKEPSSLRLLTSIIKKDKNGLKRELVGTLGAGDDQMAKIAGDSVIISDRNAKCLKVMDEEIAAGKKKLGIFYGAAHFPDMEKRLIESGWTRTGSDWLVAWDIGK